MRKRLKGLLALCLAVCIVLAGFPAAEVQAKTASGNSAGREIIFDGGIWEDKVFSGDIISARVSGGFVVFETKNMQVLETGDSENPGEEAYYRDDLSKKSDYFYFAEFDENSSNKDQKYVVPSEGYLEYAVSNVESTKYCTWAGMNLVDPGSHPVYFVYLTPLTPIEYTVKFDANGGIGTMEDMDFKYDEMKNLSKNTYTKDGYNFVGWSTEPDGENVFKDESQVNNLTSRDGETITLYAQWELKETFSPGEPAPNPEPEPEPKPEPKPEAEVESEKAETEEVESEEVPEPTEEAAAPVVNTPPATGDSSAMGMMLTLLLLAGCVLMILRKRTYQS